MNYRTGLIATIAIATTFNLLSVVQPAEATTIRLLGLTDNNNLVTFDPNNPSSIINTIAVTGVDSPLVGIDFRPANGQLFGVTANGVFTINPITGVATQVMGTPRTPFALNGTSFAVDFNPNPDAIRVVSDAEQNLRLNPNNGGLAMGAPDTPLTYAPGDPNAGANPNIVAQAYTNSFAPSPDRNRRTTLYGIDSNCSG